MSAYVHDGTATEGCISPMIMSAQQKHALLRGSRLSCHVRVLQPQAPEAARQATAMSLTISLAFDNRSRAVLLGHSCACMTEPSPTFHHQLPATVLNTQICYCMHAGVSAALRAPDLSHPSRPAGSCAQATPWSGHQSSTGSRGTAGMGPSTSACR